MTDIQNDGTEDQLQRFWWMLACCLLVFSLSSYLTSFWYIFSNKNVFKKGYDFIWILYVPIIIADFNMIINHLTRDFYNNVVNELKDDGWCQFSSVWAIASIVALHTQMVMIGHTIREMTAGRLKRDTLITRLTVVTLIAWVSGLIFGIVLFGVGVTGPYNGLYCTVQTFEKGGMMGFYFIFAFGAMGFLLYYLWQANSIALEKYKASIAFRRRPGDTEDKLPRNIQELQWFSLIVVGTFYFCWFWIALFGFLAVVQAANVPKELDAFAGVMLKTQPIVNAWILARAASSSLQAVDKSQGKGMQIESVRP